MSSKKTKNTLDCILLKESSLVLAAGLGPEINSWACLWVLVRPHHIVMPCQRLIVAFRFRLEILTAGTGPANCWTVPSLASSLRSFTNFKCPSLALQLCSFYSIIYMFTFLVDSSPQCSWRWWLEIFPSKFQRTFRHAGTEGDYGVLHYTQMAVGSQQHVPAALSQGKSACTHCRGGWLGPRVGLHGMSLRKLLPRPGFETRTVPTVAIRCNTLPRPRMRSPLGLTYLFSKQIARTCIYTRWLMSNHTRLHVSSERHTIISLPQCRPFWQDSEIRAHNVQQYSLLCLWES